ncbi:MAG TPA: hypothetical protein PLZ51_17045 [Aggregatilineales bacterium]|nr:hypothetical protein [Aggregatilineales bacterium]
MMRRHTKTIIITLLLFSFGFAIGSTISRSSAVTLWGASPAPYPAVHD